MNGLTGTLLRSCQVGALKRTPTKRRDLQNHVSELGGDERIRTAGAAFAEPCLTTWRRRRCALGRGAGDGDRTRDFLLGKEMLYH